MKQQRFMMTLAGAAALALALAGCTAAPTEAPPAEETAVPVEVATVTEGIVEEAAGLTGTLLPRKEVEVAPKVSGTIVDIRVDVGQTVREGDVLLLLEQTDASNAVKQAEASYQSALANLKQAEAGADQGLSQAENALKQAEQAYADQQRELERTKELHGSGFATDQQLEQATAAYRNAELALANARKALEIAKQQTGLAVARAAVQQALVALETARETLRNTTVVAPMTGVVSSVAATEGAFASPQAQAVRLIDTSALLVKVNVPEREINAVKPGDTVDVTVPSIGRAFAAAVETVSPVMDPQARAYPIEIAIPNEGGELKPDMVAEVRFKGAGAETASALVVPRSAVLEEGGTSYAYKVVDGTATRVEIAVGKRSADRVEVTSGLSLGDTVVTTGTTLVSDGAKVSVQTGDAP